MATKANIHDLENMKLELGDFKDYKLSLTEKINLWFNKNIVDGGAASGKGYVCSKCEGDDMEYFKREYRLIEAFWNLPPSIDVPPIHEIKLPEKIFYLMGECNYCGNEQQVSDRPNRVTYWYKEPK